VVLLYNGIILPKALQIREYPVQDEYGYTETTVNSTGSESISIQISDCWVNPLKYTDPDGDALWIPLVIIASALLLNAYITTSSYSPVKEGVGMNLFSSNDPKKNVRICKNN
jgi:hypothetical protein